MQRYQPPHLRNRPPPSTSISSENTLQPRSSSTITSTTTLPSGIRSSQRDWSQPPRPKPPSRPAPSYSSQSQPQLYSSSSPSSVSPSWKYSPPISGPRSGGTQSTRTASGYTMASPASDLKPSTRTFETSTMGEMETLVSVSRSGGEGGQGDALKDWTTQEKFRMYIDERISKHRKTFNLTSDRCSPVGANEELESLQSIVLLCRKLREGVVASGRIDAFAVEVFESSARYAIFARNHPQLRSALSGLVPGLYTAVEELSSRATIGRPGSTENDIVKQMGHLVVDDKHSMGKGPSKEDEKQDHRAEYTTLYLLHLLVQDRTMFHTTYMDLTTPPRRPILGSASSRIKSTMDGKDDGSVESAPTFDDDHYSTATQHAFPLAAVSTEAFIHPSAIPLLVLANRAMAPETFDPLLFFRLCAPEPGPAFDKRSTDLSSLPPEVQTMAKRPHVRGILSWAENDIRERSWALMKRAYLEVSVEWAEKLLGLSEAGEKGVREWVELKGGRVKDGRIKLR